MSGIVSRFFTSAALCLGLAACAVIQKYLPVSESPAEEGHRAVIARAALNDLGEIDALIRLNNDLLAEQVKAALEAQATASPSFSFNRLRVRPARQLIHIEADIDILDGDSRQSAKINGDVLLSVSGGHLVWLPRFNSAVLEAQPAPVVAEGSNDALGEEPDPAEALLNRINREISDAVIVLGRNMVHISTLPLGSIEVGAELIEFPGVTAEGSHALGGVFIVAGSTIRIEPEVTSIALDLDFIPNISTCPSDVYVSRSTFASEILNREPVGITRILEDGKADSHFFTEISGATRSTAVVHYWFADGAPVWLEELAVEPSYRWRTWSTRKVDPSIARNWEVIVVERETGCILHSQAIRVDPPYPDADAAPPAGAYDTFSTEFDQRVAAFPIGTQQPEVALIQVRRAFLNEALHTSVKDIQIVANFNSNALQERSLGGALEPFNAEEVMCEERSCTPQRTCPADFAQCIRERDSRDCTRCLFRNPLNNRCVTEGTDPICEAAKTSQNSKFDSAHRACLEQAAAEADACQRLMDQEQRSCELEATSEQTACEAGKATVERLTGATAIADVQLKLTSRGGLSAVFSGFQIEGDLERLRLGLGLSGALDLGGSIRFAPRASLGPLTNCINAWQKSISARAVLPYRANTMIAPLTLAPAELTADWSGYSVSASITPPPLEEMFVDNPSLLAECHIGLTVDKVAREITGDASAYLAGEYRLEIQPTRTRIVLSDASVGFGDMSYTAPATLSPDHLTYLVAEE